jgi:hypothetical protein
VDHGHTLTSTNPVPLQTTHGNGPRSGVG